MHADGFLPVEIVAEHIALLFHGIKIALFDQTVVGVLNGNDADNVSFKVYMGKIKANQPFLLKVVKSDVNHIDENIQWNQIQTFENKTIKDPTLDTEFVAEEDQLSNEVYSFIA